MDARPQRPRGLQPLADENMPPVVPTGHFRSKSIGTSTIMGGLNATAKRTAFADVSNTAKNKAATSQVYVKNAPQNENAANGPPAGAGKDAFRRPAQRPAKPLAAIESNHNSVASIREPTIQSSIDQIPSKKNVMVYNDKAQVQGGVENPSNEFKPPTSAASMPTIRQYKSQPQLKAEPPVLRRTQSRLLGVSSERQEEALASMGELTEALYEDALEHIVDYETGNEQVVGVEGVTLSTEAAVANFLPAATVDPASLEQEKQQPVTIDAAVLYQEEKQQPSTVDPAILSQEEKQPPASATVLSEPGEYWDEEEEEEIYDDQGYTTAHSIRSRGDLTTGGVTTLPFPKVTSKTISELEAARAYVEATRLAFDMAEDVQDLSMAAEYSEDIFQYMRELENNLLPNPHYMDIQTEIQWSMRSVLMDWLVQVHQRFSLLPETLFLAVNYVDRFLSCKVVSLGKLQLVGATAILLAAKYEEINCPSLQEIVYMVDRGYSMEEVMKAERFMLTMLQWELGWPGPMSFLRRISKADDYDHEVRTLAKYLIEVTIMDERFVGSPASFIAAGAHCLSRLLLRRGTWSPAHVYYSGYTWGQLKDLVSMILDCCQVPHQHHAAIFEKYDDKRFKYCSEFVQEEIQAGFTLATCSAYDPFFTQAKREGAGYSIDAASCNIDYLRAAEE